MTKLQMERIYDKYHLSVFRLAFAYCKNRADAEDITSDVFLKRFEADPEFTDEQHETAWMMRVTVNRAKDLLRSFRYRFSVPLEEASAVYESPEEHTVYHAVMELPAKYRAVIHLYYFEGYSVAEIGEMTGRSETAVQTQLYRARKMLKKKLGEELNGNENSGILQGHRESEA
ncbi:MAG: sigma-70 family RNA polymerase sigma factor [Oscillospiraceae bacterium]|nr:sigma-70 family RNA polymerase sigma factor [Oscillospiraceae bacterium]